MSVEVLLGIDLGSTTTKAIALDRTRPSDWPRHHEHRSNYEVASHIVREEALVRTRFTLTRHAMAADPALAQIEKAFLSSLRGISGGANISNGCKGFWRRCKPLPMIPAIATIGRN